MQRYASETESSSESESESDSEIQSEDEQESEDDVEVDETNHQSISDCYNKLIKTVHKYGGSKNDDDEYIVKPCLRVRKIKQYSVNNHKCRSYTVGFMKEYGYYPSGIVDTDSNERLEISHECANARNKKQSLCIEGSHMMLETHTENQTRTICHNYIRKYWKRYKNNDSCTTTGPITVAIVNQQLSNLYRNQVFDFQCECNTDCFINFGKIVN